ncbi:unnamed protein product [Cuscuta campestris]|uniref:CCHC-type domain-containing protein n=1 Tax=Cuscuta campestris TaxID=132261 RepID=A0A484L4I0_9ASTE|nr:unnamed protein product [Cuscuta campestris]
MGDMEEGANVQRPPLLRGPNYNFWKGRMKAFLKSQGGRVWRSVETGWQIPTKTIEGSDAKIPKTFEEYSKEEVAAAECNDKALNALFGAVDSSQYRLIANCTEAQKAWKILETTHEGDERVKTAKYQILMTKFENLRMEDKESITEFHGRVRDLENEAERLGRPFEEDYLVLKVLRALPESYSVDAKAIRQAHDLKRMTLDQLMGNLETIELAMSEEQKKKKTEKQIAFQVGDLDPENDVISDDDFQEQLSLFTKQFTKRWLQKKGKQALMQDPQRSSQIKIMKEKEFKAQPSEARRRGPQCFECGGFGHIQTECANNMKKKRQAFASTWSDEEPDTEDTDGDSNCAFVTLEVQEDSEEQLKILQEKWSDLLDINKKNVSENLLLKTKLQICEQTVEKLQHELSQKETKNANLRHKLDHHMKYQKWINKAGAGSAQEWMLSTEAKAIEHQVDISKMYGDRTGLGYPKEESTKTPLDLFIKRSDRRKEIDSLPVKAPQMTTGDNKSLKNMQEIEGGSVRFGGGAHGQIIGCGTLNVTGLPPIKNVWLVKGLQVNLLSISQICDQGLEVTFTQQKCRVKDKNKLVVLEGDRTTENCYRVSPNILCYTTSEKDARLWHYRLGHINYKDLATLSNSGVVRVMESTNVIVDDRMKRKNQDDPEEAPATDKTPGESNQEAQPEETNATENEEQVPETATVPTHIQKNHLMKNVIGSPTEGIKTRKKTINFLEMTKAYYTSTSEPKNIKEALTDEAWINAMHEELEHAIYTRLLRAQTLTLCKKICSATMVRSKIAIPQKFNHSKGSKPQPSWFKKYCQVRKKLQETREDEERVVNPGSPASIPHMQQQEDDVAHLQPSDLPQMLLIEYHNTDGPTQPPPDAPVQEDEEFIQILDEDPLVAVSKVPFQEDSAVKKSKKKEISSTVPQRRSKRKLKLEEDSSSEAPPQKKQSTSSTPMISAADVTPVVKTGKSPHSRFVSSKARSLFSSVHKKYIIVQRKIDVEDFKLKTNLIPLLEKSKLLRSVTLQGSFVKSVICEFYCNLSESCADHADPMFHKVFLHGKTYKLSPALINTALINTALDLTPSKKDTTISEKTMWVAALHWLPTTHTNTVSKTMARLLYKGFNKDEGEEKEQEEPPLQVDSRHMEGKHYNDMEVAASTTTKYKETPSLVRFLEQKLMQVKEELARTLQLKDKLEIEKDQLVVLMRQAREAHPDEEHTDSAEEIIESTHSDEQESHTEGERVCVLLTCDLLVDFAVLFGFVAVGFALCLSIQQLVKHFVLQLHIRKCFSNLCGNLFCFRLLQVVLCGK